MIIERPSYIDKLLAKQWNEFGRYLSRGIGISRKELLSEAIKAALSKL